MKNFIFISLFLLSFLASFSQVQNYTFSASAGAYTPITGGTVLSITPLPIDAFNSTAIPVSFTYNCTPVSAIRINADGHIGLGTYISTTNYTPLSGTINASIGILSVLGRDLAASDVVGATPEIRYETIGNEFIVQWTDMRRSGTTGERINFQIRINTLTNVINYVYGPYTAGAANANNPQIGLKGTNNTFPTNVNNVTLACGGTGWLGVTAGAANTSTVCLSSVTYPASGTTFTWTPGGATISGSLVACLGGTSQLTGSGTAATTNAWVSSNTSVATVSSTGLVTAIAQGTSNITYTNSTGCQVTSIFTVNANPTVTGTASLCVGGTSQLTGSGTAATTNAWVSSNAAVATVSNTGLVTGVAAGTANITYTNSLGCSVVIAITINANPTVTGANSVCVGSSTQLTGTATAATTNAWVSSNTSVATVSNTGLVSGVSAGTATITYTNTLGCTTIKTITVNANPIVTGVVTFCVGSVTQLTGSGTPATTNPWVSSNATIASVSNTGLVTGVASGNAIITYTNNNGCSAISNVIVNANPTVTGANSVCIGATTQLTGSATAATTNAWVSSNTSVATVSNTGLVTALTSGTTIITYTNNNGCQASATITVTNSPSASISYVGSPFCSSLTAAQPVTLTGTTGGTYSSTAGLSLSASTGTITPSSSTPGTYTVNYTSPASGGCSSVNTTTTVTISATPTASISYSGNSFCSSVSTAQSVTLTGTGSYTGGTYSSAPSGLTINTTTGAITPSTSAPGTYTITYTTLASGGCSGITATTQVTVSAVPTASISYTGSPYCNTIVSSQSVTLIGTGSYTGGVYSSTAGLTINPSTGSITPSTSSQGTYIINYTSLASGGCPAVIATTTVTISATPTASISYSGSSFCTSVSTAQSVTLTGTGSYTGGTYSSTTGLTLDAGTGAITPLTSTPGTYIITYTTPASGGCSTITATTTVTITAIPTASITYSNTSYCTSTTTAQSVSLTGTGSYTGGTYSSSTGLSLSASTGAITPSTSTPGTYTIIYTTPASGGCSSVTTTTTVTINPSVGTPGTITGTATLCVGSTSQTYSLSAVTNATTYSWTVPSGWTITSGAGTNSIVVTPGTAGQNGLISVTAENACGTSQASTLQVAVNALPTVNAGSDTTVCANDFPIPLTATGNATSYSWNTGANTATTTITAAGTYTVTGTLNGCSSTDNVVVISDPCAGIEENQELTFQLYPNPSNAVINITANSDEQFDYSIYSMDGKLMIVGVMNNGVISISVNHFAPGKYFTKIGAKVIAFEVTQ